MNTTPLISVIVPVYNVEKYLPRCLDSILGQSFRDIEVICIDDGSTDGSSEILFRYAEQDERLRVITQENRGIAAARNAGLDIAVGRYITFLDSDDEVASDIYEKLFSQDVEEVDALCFGAHELLDAGAEKKFFNSGYFDVKFSGKVSLQDEDLFKLSATVWNKIFLKKNIDAIGLRFPEGVLYEDNAFVWNYFIIFQNVFFEKSKLYFYYRRSGSFMDGSRKRKEGLSFHYIKIIDTIYEFWIARNILPSKQQLFEKVTRYLLRSAISSANKWETPGLVYALACSMHQWSFTPKDKQLLDISKGNLSITIGKLPFDVDIYNLRKLKGLERLFYIRNSGPYKVIGILGIRVFCWKRHH